VQPQRSTKIQIQKVNENKNGIWHCGVHKQNSMNPIPYSCMKNEVTPNQTWCQQTFYENDAKHINKTNENRRTNLVL